MPTTRNFLIGSFSVTLRQRLARAVRRVPLNPGTKLMTRGKPIDTVWFPETVIVNLAETLGHGTAQDIGMVGCEGVIGWSAVMDEADAPFDATVVMSSGTALELPAASLREIAASEPEISGVLFRFAHRFNVQVARSLASHLRDPAERRIARLLLMLHDRSEGDTLTVTHRFLGNALNLRRATVTDSLHVLEGEAIVRCVRGRITLRNRSALEGVAGASYSAAEGRGE